MYIPSVCPPHRAYVWVVPLAKPYYEVWGTKCFRKYWYVSIFLRLNGRTNYLGLPLFVLKYHRIAYLILLLMINAKSNTLLPIFLQNRKLEQKFCLLLTTKTLLTKRKSDSYFCTYRLKLIRSERKPWKPELWCKSSHSEQLFERLMVFKNARNANSKKFFTILQKSWYRRWSLFVPNK